MEYRSMTALAPSCALLSAVLLLGSACSDAPSSPHTPRLSEQLVVAAMGTDGTLHLQGHDVIRTPPDPSLEELARFHVVGSWSSKEIQIANGPIDTVSVCTMTRRRTPVARSRVSELTVEHSASSCQWILAIVRDRSVQAPALTAGDCGPNLLGSPSPSLVGSRLTAHGDETCVYWHSAQTIRLRPLEPFTTLAQSAIHFDFVTDEQFCVEEQDGSHTADTYWNIFTDWSVYADGEWNDTISGCEGRGGGWADFVNSDFWGGLCLFSGDGNLADTWGFVLDNSINYDGSEFELVAQVAEYGQWSGYLNWSIDPELELIGASEEFASSDGVVSEGVLPRYANSSVERDRDGREYARITTPSFHGVLPLRGGVTRK